jgi:hypothetical protein
MRLVPLLLVISCGGAGTRAQAPAPAARGPSDTGKRPTLARPPAEGKAQPTALLDAMKQELDRTFAALGNKADGPYFLAYEV